MSLKKHFIHQFCRLSLIVAAAFVFALPVIAQPWTISTTGVPSGSMGYCDGQMQRFMSNYQIPGATFAIAKNGRLIYMRAFGKANQAGTETTQPYHMFRIASLSKPITSVAIMKLIENGQLSLSDKPFGAGGILNNDSYFANANVTDRRVYDITIQNLLEHSAGWNRDLPMPEGPLSPYPWSYSHSDPVSFPLHVTQTLGEPNPVTRRAMIKFLMQKGLDFAPGTGYAYSNIGYAILGEVIEKKTGMTYENYVKTQILVPSGIYDTHIGKILLADKREREGEYNDGSTTLSAFGTGEYVQWQYGGFSMAARDAHGGWISTARDLARFITTVDGFSSRPDILSAETLQMMTTPSANNAYYAKGWSVNPSNNWSHTGALNGTASIMARTNGEFVWAIILNKRGGDSFWRDLDRLPWNCVNSTSSYPDYDLFDVPTQNASAMSFSGVTTDSMTVNWTNGDGDGRVLVMRAGGTPNKFPLDGTDYSAGGDLGGGNYVVYSGAGNSASVGNLIDNTNYQFRLYEYKKNDNTGNYALYQLANASSGSQNTLAASDTIPPSIAINAPVETNYLLGQNVSANYSCSDGESGVASCVGTISSGATINTASVGTKTFTVTAADNAGNTASKTVAYNVGYNIISLFDQTKLNNSGSAIPIKIQIADASGANRSAANIAVRALSLMPGNLPVQAPGNSQPGNLFKFENGVYQFNLKSETTWASGTYQLFFRITDDPVEHSVQFRIR